MAETPCWPRQESRQWDQMRACVGSRTSIQEEQTRVGSAGKNNRRLWGVVSKPRLGRGRALVPHPPPWVAEDLPRFLILDQDLG